MRDSSTIIVNFLMSFFLISLLILLYNTDVFIPNFFDRFGTEILPSRVSSVIIFMSSSSNLCKFESYFLLLFNKCKFYCRKLIFLQFKLHKMKFLDASHFRTVPALNDFK